ncbi:MAG: hypothetical protein KAT00_02225 [Planctomycetes bacterium]|nr:hypothetical protein [Planctomycetota bacterium]
MWTRFLEAKAESLGEVWYDLHVGTAVRVLEDMPNFMERVSDAVTRKRIDVVARVGAGFWVIEVKPICGTKAIGQALNYVDLFMVEFAGAAAVVPVVVCELVEIDVIETADSLGVLVFTLDGVLE